MTTIALLPPSSSSERPSRSATAVPTFSPMSHEPVAEMSGIRRSLMSGSPTVGAAADDEVEDALETGIRHDLVDDVGDGDRGERGLRRRLPDHGVAAHAPR